MTYEKVTNSVTITMITLTLTIKNVSSVCQKTFKKY